VLADAVEALIGALYLDGGFKEASRFIHHYWEPHVGSGASSESDPKSALQEWAQGKGFPLPAYRLVERSGPAHKPPFIIEVQVKGHKPVTAEGTSKREAEKLAAKQLLGKLK
jgi:ribonuclease-3